jgi:cardiolipin synthase C
MNTTLAKHCFFVILLMLLQPFCHAGNLSEKIQQLCMDCEQSIQTLTGLYILEEGEEALISRAWLTQHVAKTIDVQYFIWSTDNIGILAGEALLSAAERGVKVRVIVDDLLIDAADETLLFLDAHPNVEIKIYNPQHSVGVSTLQRVFNVVSGFRKVNQRMHDKTVIFEYVVGITGGRNMADEYFNYDHQYNFRDRDILLVGKSVNTMTENFDAFWKSDLSVPVSEILHDKKQLVTPLKIQAHWQALHEYAANEGNFEPQVRDSLSNFEQYFASIMPQLVWDKADFIHDAPGKNANTFSLGGGSAITKKLTGQLKHAKKTVLIESPYLILSDEAIEVFAGLLKRGVSIKIVTNSLASTDNLRAFSGYHNQREELVAMGIEIYEFKPHPQIQKDLVKRYDRLKQNNPVFAMHAKSMVIDGEILYIGTFNLDPRSMNLNTEVGVLVKNSRLGKQLQDNIQRDMLSGNSWRISEEFNPDDEVDFSKRTKLLLYKMLPMQALL